MNAVSARAVLAVLVVVGMSLAVLEGCRTPAVLSDSESQQELSQPTIAVEQGRLRARAGCEYDYTIYRAAGYGATGDEASANVLLAHGFLRDRARMADLARALADAGLTTVTLDLCNMRPWNGAHRENALEMRRLSAQLGITRLVYAGFSAGGLAALLAAADTSDVVGVLVLDLVDQAGMGLSAVQNLAVPVVGLFGDASSCNANLNGVGVIEAAARGQIIRIPGATHCDFESPSDGLCRLVCEPPEREDSPGTDLRASIIEQAVLAAKRLAHEDRPAAPSP